MSSEIPTGGKKNGRKTMLMGESSSEKGRTNNTGQKNKM